MTRKRRKAPGESGRGKYYHVTIRPKGRFSKFRAHDVGRKGGLIRVAGYNKKVGWDTQKWLIEKRMAKVKDSVLIGTHPHSKRLLSSLPGKEKRIKGDIFKGKPQRKRK